MPEPFLSTQGQEACFEFKTSLDYTSPMPACLENHMNRAKQMAQWVKALAANLSSTPGIYIVEKQRTDYCLLSSDPRKCVLQDTLSHKCQ